MMQDVINNAANSNLANLTPAGKNIASWSTNVTDCPIELPKNIHLELDSGTLTLKAGSKIINPSGTEKVTGEDHSTTIGTDNTYYVFANTSNGAIGNYIRTDRASVGTSLPADGSTYRVFLNTTDHIIYLWNADASTWNATNWSFPICRVTVSSGAISSIDEIYNGIGRMEKRPFILTGTAFIIPNGRNADGTLNNLIVRAAQPFVAGNDGSARNGIFGYDTGRINRINTASYKYDETKNKYIRVSDGEEILVARLGTITGDVDTMTIKEPFRAMDWADKLTVAGWGLPDTAHAVSVTLPYTAIENCIVAVEHIGNSASSTVGNGLIVDNIYGFATTNGVYGGGANPTMHGCLAVPQGSTVTAASIEGTYTVTMIPMKGAI